MTIYHQTLQVMVSMIQKVSSHGSLDYHLTTFTKMRSFLHTYENPSEAVNTSLDSRAQKRLEENQHVLESLFKIVMLLGKQGLALRGHLDDIIVWTVEVDQKETQGNFIEMVRFRAETDDVLRKHIIDYAPRNAQYTSKTMKSTKVQTLCTI